MMTRSRTALLVALGLMAGVAAPSEALGQTVSVQVEERGWVGISYELRQSQTGAVSVIITQVSNGSPAQRAGISVGDVLLSLNGEGVQSNFGNVPLRIRPGEPVQVVVSRGGDVQRVRVVAMERPTQFRQQAAVTLTLTADSMVESMFRAMDSLRLTLVTPEGEVRVLGLPPELEGRVRVVQEPETGVLLERVERGREALPFLAQAGELQRQFTFDEVRAPFGFWVFRTEAHDSLRRAMERLNQEIRDVRLREADRLHLVVDESGRLRMDQTDDELVQLRSVLKSYVDRSVILREAMDRAAREAAEPRTGYAVTWRTPDEVESREENNTFFGPLTPYALGQNRAAGAEIVELQPELADYFEVDGGVLVVDVLPGTPAAIAGLHPGDVITHLDRVTVRSLQELRTGLSRTGPATPITVVRRGNAIQLLLRR